MKLRLAVNEDVVEAGRTSRLCARPRAVFVRHGRLRIASAERVQDAGEGDCVLVRGACTLEGVGEAWTFEVSRFDGAAGDSERERVVLAVTIDHNPSSPLLMRADRVTFDAGVVTPRHGHKGPGIRRLIHGRLHAELGDEHRRIEAGDAWFESGREPVVGRNMVAASAFVRVMVLDPALKGQQTFIPWTEADAAASRGTRRQLYFDELVALEG